jgi:phospholipase/carboxylesterase
MLIELKKDGSASATLQHLVFYPTESRTSYPTIVALHGRGADYSDLPPLIGALKIPGLLVIAPRAPFTFMNGGFAWYELQNEGIPSSESFISSLNRLRKFLKEIREIYPVDDKRVFLLGFSQGTVMAYAAGLQEHKELRGIVALSGYIPIKSGLPLELDDLSGLAVFISHGIGDELIPVRYGREAAKILTQAQADVLYTEYPMGHQIIDETISDLTKWMKEQVT